MRTSSVRDDAASVSRWEPDERSVGAPTPWAELRSSHLSAALSDPDLERTASTHTHTHTSVGCGQGHAQVGAGWRLAASMTSPVPAVNIWPGSTLSLAALETEAAYGESREAAAPPQRR